MQRTPEDPTQPLAVRWLRAAELAVSLELIDAVCLGRLDAPPGLSDDRAAADRLGLALPVFDALLALAAALDGAAPGAALLAAVRGLQAGQVAETDAHSVRELLLRELQTASGAPAPDVAETVIDPLIGRTLSGKLRIERMIGQGGMGRVYEALHLRLDRRCVVKLLGPELLRNPEAVARFEREARAVARLDHPNIVALHDIDTDGELHYIAMELLAGSPLDQLVRRSGPLPESEAVALCRQAAEGLAAAHAAGIIHRDVKPSNLIRHDDGRLKVLDFGLARLVAEQDGVSRPGQVVGTPHFMAPEQARGQPSGVASDIYSLGVTLFLLVSGRVPFEGSQPQAVLYQLVNEPPMRPRAAAPGISEGLERVILKMIARSPADRYASMEDCVRAFDALAGAPRAARWPRRLPVVALLLATAILLALAWRDWQAGRTAPAVRSDPTQQGPPARSAVPPRRTAERPDAGGDARGAEADLLRRFRALLLERRIDAVEPLLRSFEQPDRGLSGLVAILRAQAVAVRRWLAALPELAARAELSGVVGWRLVGRLHPAAQQTVTRYAASAEGAQLEFSGQDQVPLVALTAAGMSTVCDRARERRPAADLPQRTGLLVLLLHEQVSFESKRLYGTLGRPVLDAVLTDLLLKMHAGKGGMRLDWSNARAKPTASLLQAGQAVRGDWYAVGLWHWDREHNTPAGLGQLYWRKLLARPRRIRCRLVCACTDPPSRGARVGLLLSRMRSTRMNDQPGNRHVFVGAELATAQLVVRLVDDGRRPLRPLLQPDRFARPRRGSLSFGVEILRLADGIERVTLRIGERTVVHTLKGVALLSEPTYLSVDAHRARGRLTRLSVDPR